MLLDEVEPEFASRDSYGVARAFSAHGFYCSGSVAVSDVVAHQSCQARGGVYGFFGVYGHEYAPALQSVVHQLRTRFKSFYGEWPDVYFLHGI